MMRPSGMDKNEHSAQSIVAPKRSLKKMLADKFFSIARHTSNSAKLAAKFRDVIDKSIKY